MLDHQLFHLVSQVEQPMQITGSKLVKRKNIFLLEVAVNHLRMFSKRPDFILRIRRIRCRLVHATSNEYYIHRVDRSSIVSRLAQQVFSPIELSESAACILRPVHTYGTKQVKKKPHPRINGMRKNHSPVLQHRVPQWDREGDISAFSLSPSAGPSAYKS